jgi:hypothetical protein
MNPVRKIASIKPDVANRYMVRQNGAITGPYTVEGLYSLAGLGKITKSAELAKAETNGALYAFSPITRWPMAARIFPAAAMKLAIKVAEEVTVVPKIETPVAKSRPAFLANRPFIAREEVDDLLARDPNHPMVVQLRADIGEAIRTKGISAERALNDILRDNARRLNRMVRAGHETPRMIRQFTVTQVQASLVYLMVGGAFFTMTRMYPTEYSPKVTWLVLGLGFLATAIICKFGDFMERTFRQLPRVVRYGVPFLCLHVIYILFFVGILWAVDAGHSYQEILAAFLRNGASLFEPFTPVKS